MQKVEGQRKCEAYTFDWGSLLVAKRIQEHDGSYALLRYCYCKICNTNSASATLKKWMKPRLKDDAMVHSFRHSTRDRLRAGECPSDIIDLIGGWSSFSMGAPYGKGYELPVLTKWTKMPGLNLAFCYP